MYVSHDQEILTKIRELNETFMKAVDTARSQGVGLEEALELTNGFVEAVMGELVDGYGLIPVLGFSGGKDSAVMLHAVYTHLRRLGYEKQLKVLYVEVTGNTHEESVEYVYRFIGKLGVPRENFVHLRADRDFYELLVRWGFPSPRRRWCMTVFKRNVVLRFLRELGGNVIVFVGDRLSDSGRRKSLLTRRGVLEYNGYWRQYTFHPIIHWSLGHVLEYIVRYNLELNPLYTTIGSSGNCVYCPFITDTRYYQRLKQHYPQWLEKILDAEKAMRNNGGAILVSNRVYRLNDIVKNGEAGKSYERLLKYGRRATFCSIFSCVDLY